VWEAHKDAGYRLTERRPRLHIFVYDRGGAQENFVQLEVWEEQEFVERELFPRDDHWGLPDLDELRRGSPGMALVERSEPRDLGVPQYRLEHVIDMQKFIAIGNAAYTARRRAEGDRRWLETNSTTGEQRVVTARELMPGYDQVRWESQRFFDDWAASSAGRAGERACRRWSFNTSDYTDPKGVRHLSFVPQWAHTCKIAELKNTGKLPVHHLYGKLMQLDARIGMPFAWYFYGLHGLIGLPEHDYAVLRRWHETPYGF
jgi:hypothetical protein